MEKILLIVWLIFFLGMIVVLLYNLKKIKYRIIKYEFPNAKTLYFAQYKFIFWMYIGFFNEGHFINYSHKTRCESLEEAKQRIEKHKINMKREEEWPFKSEYKL